MSKKEREQLIVLSKLKSREISQKEAALRLKWSTRWIRKKFKRLLHFGDAGLIHKSRGKESKRRWNEHERNRAMALLKSEWSGFGPTFAAEKLRECEGIVVSSETLRKAMIEEGIWKPERKRSKHRKRRERRDMLGLLVQLDGSPHDWFEGRGPKCTLLVFIDDATSKILWLEFVNSESSLEVMRATKHYFEKCGRPQAFYVDFGSVFSVNLNNPERDKKSQWGRVMQECDVEVIHAHSPQAKGRVERANKTLQDRLVKEMRMASITSMQEANTFLSASSFIERHNQRFSVQPLRKGNAHRLVALYDLDSVFCLQEKRVLANDFTIVHRKKIFQLGDEQNAVIRPKNSITVSTMIDGSIRLSIRNIKLSFKEIQNRNIQKPKERTMKQRKPLKPSANSRRWVAGLSPIQMETNTPRRVG